MPDIKRYPNRKLYDTEAKQYITLEGIAEIIRQGQEVRVVDHASGEDITALTLTQIIYEQEKKQSGLLPYSILTGLIQASGERLQTVQRALTASVNYWHQIDEEIRNRIQNLVKQGDLTENEGIRLVDKLLKQRPRLQEDELSEEQLQKALEDRQVPTRQDLQELMHQLDELTDKLEDISESE
jgi:polyhydroxyalkanoate synthesis repressor PhaR